MLNHSERILATDTIPSRVFLPRLNAMLVFFKDPTLDEEFEALLTAHADEPITTEMLLPLLKQDVYFR